MFDPSVFGLYLRVDEIVLAYLNHGNGFEKSPGTIYRIYD